MPDDGHRCTTVGQAATAKGGSGSAVPVRPIELRTCAQPCIECRPAAQDRVRRLWRMNIFERPSAYGGCPLKPGVGVAIFWPMG